MRLRLAFALAALTALAACDQSPKATRAPIGAAGTPVAATAPAAAPAANCPTVKPACPTPPAVHAKAHRTAPKKAVRHAAAQATPRVATSRRYAQAEPTVGLPPRPYRYDELYPAPPPPMRHRRAEAEDGYGRYERHEHWEERGGPRPPPPPAMRHGYDRQGEAYADERGYAYGESRRDDSYAESRSAYVEEDGCRCAGRTQAAGFDSRGFLTWPGKVPAR